MSSLAERGLNLLSRRRRVDRAVRELFASPDGRVVLVELLGITGVLATSHVRGDSHDTAFNEGRRSVGLELMARLRWTEAELQMLSQERATDSALDLGENS